MTVHPVERYGVAGGELSQICLGNFRGSDSAAAIPWCETKFVLRHLSPSAGKGYLITGISCCTRLIPQTHLDIILTDIDCLWTTLTMSLITCNNQLILKQIYWAVYFLYKCWSDSTVEFIHTLFNQDYLTVLESGCSDHEHPPRSIACKTSPNFFGSTSWPRHLKSLAREPHWFSSCRGLLSVFGSRRTAWDQIASVWRFIYHR